MRTKKITYSALSVALMAWTQSTYSAERNESLQIKNPIQNLSYEEVTMNKTYLQIHGVVVATESPDTVFIYANNMIYQFKRSGISTKDPSLLEINGASVELIAPRTALEFSWSTENLTNSVR